MAKSGWKVDCFFFTFGKVVQSRYCIRKLVVGVNMTIDHSGYTSELVEGKKLAIRTDRKSRVDCKKWKGRRKVEYSRSS